MEGVGVRLIPALAGNGVSLITALACTQCTIPFCRKREALNRECGYHRQGVHWLVRTGLQNGIPNSLGRALAGGVLFSLRWWVSEEHLFRFFLLLRVVPLPFFPALAGPSFRLAGQGIALTLAKWFSEMHVVSVRGGWPNGMVHLLVVAACSCGLPVFRQSLRCRLFVFRQSLLLWVAQVVVAHRPRGQPMHHSVLPEEGGVEPRVRLSSSKQVVARESRMAKRNPRLARARTGGIAPLPSPPALAGATHNSRP